MYFSSASRVKRALRSCSESSCPFLTLCARNPSSDSFIIWSAPRLLVRMIIVLRKLTSLPFASVNTPSSSSCNSKLNTSGCAFSISSKSTTEKGFFIIWAVSELASRDPSAINRETSSRFTYSFKSRRIILSSPLKYTSESAFESSVFPTPVGPRNKNVPIGRFWFRTPVLARRKAFATTETAFSCPTIRAWSRFSRFRRVSFSSSTFAVEILTFIVCSIAFSTELAVTILFSAKPADISNNLTARPGISKSKIYLWLSR